MDTARVMACAQNHRVLVDFTPESRDYGEMPLKAGEEVGNPHPSMRSQVAVEAFQIGGNIFHSQVNFGGHTWGIDCVDSVTTSLFPQVQS